MEKLGIDDRTADGKPLRERVFERSLVAYERALTQDRNSDASTSRAGLYHFEIGRVLLALGRFDGAMQEFEQVDGSSGILKAGWRTDLVDKVVSLITSDERYR